MAKVKRPAPIPATRRERAQTTHRRIVKAAGDLFAERGYAATTMAAIAERADVAVQTVYFTFHTKTALLAAVADVAITGGAGIDPGQASWVQDVLAARDGTRRIALFVDGVATIIPRMLPIIAAWSAAIAADPAALAEYRQRLLSRRQFAFGLIAATNEQGQLRPGLSPDRAADILFALTTPEQFETCTRLLGWSVEEWKTWVKATLARELLR